LSTFVRDGAEVLTAEVGTETFTVTPEHPFWVPEQGWVAVGGFGESELAITACGDRGAVTIAGVGGTTTVHNIEVEGLNTYLIGEQGVVVHNNNCAQPPKPTPLLPAPPMHKHHIFSVKHSSWFRERGIDPDAFVVGVGESNHLRGIHGRGQGDMPGRWVQRWDKFINENPNATAKEVYQYGGTFMDDFGIGHVPITRY